MTSQSEHSKRRKAEVKDIKAEVKDMGFADMLVLVQEAEEHHHFLVGYFGEYNMTGAGGGRQKNVSLQELTEVILRVERGIY